MLLQLSLNLMKRVFSALLKGVYLRRMVPNPLGQGRKIKESSSLHTVWRILKGLSLKSAIFFGKHVEKRTLGISAPCTVYNHFTIILLLWQGTISPRESIILTSLYQRAIGFVYNPFYFLLLFAAFFASRSRAFAAIRSL